MVLWEAHWNGLNRVRLNPAVSVIYINQAALESGFDKDEKQRIPLPERISGHISHIAGLDVLLKRSGWRREPVNGDDLMLHHLLACY